MSDQTRIDTIPLNIQKINTSEKIISGTVYAADLPKRMREDLGLGHVTDEDLTTTVEFTGLYLIARPGNRDLTYRLYSLDLFGVENRTVTLLEESPYLDQEEIAGQIAKRHSPEGQDAHDRMMRAINDLFSRGGEE